MDKCSEASDNTVSMWHITHPLSPYRVFQSGSWQRELRPVTETHTSCQFIRTLSHEHALSKTNSNLDLMSPKKKKKKKATFHPVLTQWGGFTVLQLKHTHLQGVRSVGSVLENHLFLKRNNPDPPLMLIQQLWGNFSSSDSPLLGVSSEEEEPHPNWNHNSSCRSRETPSAANSILRAEPGLPPTRSTR